MCAVELLDIHFSEEAWASPVSGDLGIHCHFRQIEEDLSYNIFVRDPDPTRPKAHTGSVGLMAFLNEFPDVTVAKPYRRCRAVKGLYQGPGM
jgi:hypothetical protein